MLSADEASVVYRGSGIENPSNPTGVRWSARALSMLGK